MRETHQNILLASVAGASLIGIAVLESAKRRRKPHLRLPWFRWPTPRPRFA